MKERINERAQIIKHKTDKPQKKKSEEPKVDYFKGIKLITSNQTNQGEREKEMNPENIRMKERASNRSYQHKKEKCFITYIIYFQADKFDKLR